MEKYIHTHTAYPLAGSIYVQALSLVYTNVPWKADMWSVDANTRVAPRMQQMATDPPQHPGLFASMARDLSPRCLCQQTVIWQVCLLYRWGHGLLFITAE